MARKANTGSSVDSAVAKGIGVDFGSREIADVLVDGRRLGEIQESLRTPDPFEVRPETKYREVFAAAAAIVRLGLDGAKLVTLTPDGSERERPDLLMRYGGRQYGVEASRVKPTARERNALINEALAADEWLRPRSLVVHFGVSASAVATLAKGEQQKQRDEIVALLFGGYLRFIPTGTPRYSVFARDSVAARLGVSVAVEDISARSSGYGILVRLVQDAPGDALVQPILKKLEGKRRSASAPDYDRSNPLWLVLEVTEQTGTFWSRSARSARTRCGPLTHSSESSCTTAGRGACSNPPRRAEAVTLRWNPYENRLWYRPSRQYDAQVA